jgi:hypothetical protein
MLKPRTTARANAKVQRTQVIVADERIEKMDALARKLNMTRIELVAALIDQEYAAQSRKK